MKILFKGNNWLGDAVMSLYTIKAAKDKFPDSHIAVLTNKDISDLYKTTDFIDNVISYNNDNFNFFKVSKDLRIRNFDTAVVFPRSFSSAFAIYLADVRTRIGYESDLRRLFLTIPLPRKNGVLKEHRVYYYLNLLKPLADVSHPTSFKLSIPIAEREWADQTLSSLGKDNDIIIGINPGASYGIAKCWYPERFSEVAKSLIKKYNAKVLILGSIKESPIAESIINAVRQGAYNLAGKTTLSQLIAIIEKCKLFLTNDTGPMHIADVLGVPIVAIFGPTDPITTSPFGKKNTVIYNKVDCSPCLLRTCPIDHSCMQSISPQEVLRACESWLDR